MHFLPGCLFHTRTASLIQPSQQRRWIFIRRCFVERWAWRAVDWQVDGGGGPPHAPSSDDESQFLGTSGKYRWRQLPVTPARCCYWLQQHPSNGIPNTLSIVTSPSVLPIGLHLTVPHGCYWGCLNQCTEFILHPSPDLPLKNLGAHDNPQMEEYVTLLPDFTPPPWIPWSKA